MATGQLAPVPRQRILTDLGLVSPGALLHAYVGGTPSTPLPTFSDLALTVQNANPQVASTGGLFGPIYLTPGLDYHFVLTDASGATLWDQDHVSVPATALLVSPAFTGVPTAPTAALGTNTTQIATTAFVQAAVVPVDQRVNDFRLTLTTALPVTTADVLAAITLYCTPYVGTRIALYDGVNWNQRTSAEVSIAIPAVASQCYDVFGWDNAGVFTLELLAWTNDTTRATALVRQDGVWSKTGALTRRYLGSVRTTTVAGQTEDSASKRYVWNAAHRLDRPLERIDPTVSWTYNVNTIRQANFAGVATANQVEVVIGVSEDPVVLEVVTTVVQGGAGNNMAVGIGLDSTTTFAAHQSVQVGTPVALAAVALRAQYRGYPGVGRHVLSWNEDAGVAGTTTFYGTATTINAITIAASSQSGLFGVVRG